MTFIVFTDLKLQDDLTLASRVNNKTVFPYKKIFHPFGVDYQDLNQLYTLKILWYCDLDMCGVKTRVYSHAIGSVRLYIGTAVLWAKCYEHTAEADGGLADIWS